jgi:SAM-dependent methyltransferase
VAGRDARQYLAGTHIAAAVSEARTLIRVPTSPRLTSGFRSFWERLSRPARELRWRFARWSTSSDREFHDGVFGAQHHDPFSSSYPGNLTIRRFADLAAQRLVGVRSVLDLGCGPGEITCELARRYPDITFNGFDHSAVAIERARHHARRLGLKNADFAVADLESFRPQTLVDLIAMFDAFHHVLDPSGFVARLRPFCPRFFLIEPGGSWTGQWERRRDLDWLPATVMQMAERLEYEFEVPSVAPPGPAASSPPSSDPTEHRYTLVDFERFFEGFSLEVRGTIAGLEQYGARPYDRSSLRDRFGRVAYDLVVGIEEALVEEGLDLAAKHWAIFATSEPGTTAGRRLTEQRRLPSRPAARALMPPYSARYDSYAGPSHAPSGEIFPVTVHITNTGWRDWNSAEPQPVHVSYHWMHSDGRTLVHDGVRTPLPSDVPSGQEAVMIVRVEAPPGAGQYVLAIDLVHEGVTWFSEQGVPPHRVSFRIS